jgi:hypothetical protein
MITIDNTKNIKQPRCRFRRGGETGRAGGTTSAVIGGCELDSFDDIDAMTDS